MSSLLLSSNNPLAAKAFSSIVTAEALRESYFGRFTGQDSEGRFDTDDAGSLICVKTDLKKAAGDRITVPLRVQLQGEGQVSGETLEGNEEAIDYRSFPLNLDELAHAVRHENKMGPQRVSFDLSVQSRNALKDWFVEAMDRTLMSHLAGDTLSNGIKRYVGGNTITAPTYHYMKDAANNATEAAIQSSATAAVDSITLQDISRMKTQAKKLRIRPVSTPGIGKGSHYVIFMHDDVELNLRTAVGTDTWASLQKAFASGGGSEREDNPILSGASFVYDGCIVHATDKMPKGIDAAGTGRLANVYRTVLAGAQAAGLAFGQDSDENEFTYREELHDYGRELGSSMSSIFGMSKTVFTGVDDTGAADSSTALDHAAIVLSSYATSAETSF